MMNKQTVLITGANSGIGRATVLKYLSGNYNVIGHYNKSNDFLKEISNKDLFTIQGDLSSVLDIEKVFNYCIKKTDKLDVLINNAGTMHISDTIENISLESYEYVMDVNTRAPFILSQLALRQMKKQNNGRIINISSIGVKYGGNPISATYTISKSALESMTLLFAKAGAPYNVLVNALRVGITDTNFHKNNLTKNLENRKTLVPLKRMAHAEEIANSIFFFTSNQSSYTTGSIITIAGGE